MNTKFEEHRLYEIEILNVLTVKSDQSNKHKYSTGSRLLNDTMYGTIIGNKVAIPRKKVVNANITHFTLVVNLSTSISNNTFLMNVFLSLYI